MLQNEGRDPHVVGRDGSALLSQLPVNRAVMMRGLFIGVEHTDAGLQQKTAQDSLVARSRAAQNKPAHGKTGAQFSQHDERQPDFIGVFDRFDNGRIAAAEVGIAVRVERQPHRHISSSMLSCAANALSKALQALNASARPVTTSPLFLLHWSAKRSLPLKSVAHESMPSQNEPGTLIVTGASRGIGAAIAKLAGARGFSIALNFATGQSEAAEIAQQIVSAGGHACAIQADVAREENVVRLFETAERELGPIKALVNNAAITGGVSRVESVSASTLARVMAVNVTGAFLCAREAVRRMSTRRGGTGGAIVNISSRAARIGSAGEWVHYAASKGAIDSFTIGLAREVATEGIRVNAVAPGLIETGLHAANGMPDRLDRLAATIPMQRPGTAPEVAEAVVWLLSPAASYTTGAILEVSGGR
jgi:NAD(P)-dependent dehydrogenase (short-subunit alcohol dehydrogenase family)